MIKEEEAFNNYFKFRIGEVVFFKSQPDDFYLITSRHITQREGSNELIGTYGLFSPEHSLHTVEANIKRINCQPPGRIIKENL